MSNTPESAFSVGDDDKDDEQNPNIGKGKKSRDLMTNLEAGFDD